MSFFNWWAYADLWHIIFKVDTVFQMFLGTTYNIFVNTFQSIKPNTDLKIVQNTWNMIDLIRMDDQFNGTPLSLLIYNYRHWLFWCFKCEEIFLEFWKISYCKNKTSKHQRIILRLEKYGIPIVIHCIKMSASHKYFDKWGIIKNSN